MAARHTRKTLTALGAACALAACKAPSINLATSEPIKVDIAMRLDVYQHEATGPSPAATPKPAPGTTSAISPGPRRKDRSADIQTFKNSRYVGEGHDGLLVILSAPDGDAGDYLRHTVAAENADRMSEMKAYAKAQNLSLAEVQASQGELWSKRAFTGEWIEVRGSDGSYKWLQKAG